MSSLKKLSVPPFRLHGPEIALGLLGVVGFVLYFLFLPGQHPDSTINYEIDSEEAVDRARTFLASQGYIMDAAAVHVTLERNKDVLNSLQETYGRTGTVTLLDTTELQLPAAYRWKVRFQHRESDKDENAALADLETIFLVSLTPSGEVYSADNRLSSTDDGPAMLRYGSSRTAVNRSVLAAGLASDTSNVQRIRMRLTTIADSTLRTRIGFDSTIAGDGVGADARVDKLEESGSVTLGPRDVERMAAMHLTRIAPGSLQLSLDTLTVSQGVSAPTATVVYRTDEPVHGQMLQTTLSMTPTGNVAEVEFELNPDREELVSPEPSEVLDIARVGAWGMLALIIIIVFFRRMIARLIDIKSAMLDAMFLGLVFGGSTALAFQEWLLQAADVAIWVNILFRLLIFSVVGGAAALLAFMVSGVGESLGRETFPHKMRTMSLMRHGDYRNQPVGAVLIRGILSGGLLLGICILAMTASPGLALDLDVLFAADYYMRPILSGVFNSMTAGYLVVLMVLVSLGAASSMLADGNWTYLAAITIAGAVLQVIPVDLISSWWTLLYSGLFMLVLAWLFVRYDAMTAFMAYGTARLLAMLSEGVLITGSPAGIDLLLGVLFLVTLLVIGAIGVASGRSERELHQYVPAYVTQMASQERVKRELELAHQVQASFLPRTMPQVAGLDLAGMCLPANEVGGDYYDFIQFDENRLAFVVGDVSGKGIHAAFFMTLVKGILQTLSREFPSPADVMRRLNHLFCLNAPSGVFISMIYGVVDNRTGNFRFARAGHNPAILCRAGSQDAEFLQPSGMAIGFADGERFDSNIEEATVTLNPGDTLVFYTDGFSEAMNKSRSLYGDERLAKKVGQIGGRSANAILRSVTEDVHHFIEGAGRSDDMTMVVLKMNGTT